MVGLGFRPDTTLESWAQEEAAARLKRLENREEVKFGVHYHQLEKTFTKEEVGAVPMAEDEEEEE